MQLAAVSAMLGPHKQAQTLTLELVSSGMFLYIICCPISYLKHYVSETGCCVRLLVEPTELDSISLASGTY
jgi:hypothetical protein